MTKKEIFEAFGGHLSKTGIVLRDDSYILRGKWALIEKVDDQWDVWVCNHENLNAGLPALKLTWLLKGLEAAGIGEITRLDGEAYFRVDSPDEILPLASLLGLRRKRRESAADIKAKTERLRKLL